MDEAVMSLSDCWNSLFDTPIFKCFFIISFVCFQICILFYVLKRFSDLGFMFTIKKKFLKKTKYKEPWEINKE